MLEITPDIAGNALIIMVGIYGFSMAYSIYMAVVNWKQARVKEILEVTNVLMISNNDRLDRIIELLETKKAQDTTGHLNK